MRSKISDDGVAKRFDGRFSDGGNAGSVEAEVRLGKAGLEISTNNGGSPILWPYDALAVAEPLRRNSIDALVTCHLNDGATLFVPGGVFARILGDYAPQLTTGAERWRNARPWLVGAGVAVLGVVAVYVADLSPARYVASFIPDSVRDSLGKQTVQSMTGRRGVCVASEGQDALDRLVKKLSVASGSDADFKVTVIDWALLNAFATPGEYIVLTRKLITSARSPDELAGVIAHEMGHGISRHPESGLVRAVGLSATIELLVGGGGGTAANFGLLLAQLSYTRVAEKEADAQALQILKTAKISTKGLQRFFERISPAASPKKADEAAEGTPKKSTGTWSQGLDILRTHPDPIARLKRIKAQGSYPSSPALSSTDWAALQKICTQTEGGRASSDKPPNDALERPDVTSGSDDKSGGK